jgi:hypothetical protein
MPTTHNLQAEAARFALHSCLAAKPANSCATGHHPASSGCTQLDENNTCNICTAPLQPSTLPHTPKGLHDPDVPLGLAALRLHPHEPGDAQMHVYHQPLGSWSNLLQSHHTILN